MKRLILLSTVLSFPLFASTPKWNLCDVSLLFPLDAKLLSPADSGSNGPLLSRALFDRVPPLTDTGVSRNEIYQNQLKLVSIRIDPCPNTFDERLCSPEIRLIWQPVTKDEQTKEWIGEDATLHSFYAISKSEFQEFKVALMKWKMANEQDGLSTSLMPLGVHPALGRGPKREALQSLLLKTVGEKNIYKLTFMSLLTRNVWWRFGGIEKNGGTWARVKIPRITSPFQDIFNSALEENAPENNSGLKMNTDITLDIQDYPLEDNLLYLTSEGFRYNDERDQKVFFEKLSAIDRFRNPMKTNPTTLDCASCHYADNAKFYAESQFPSLKNIQTKDAFINPDKTLFDLENKTIGPKGTRLVRAFGYFQEKPSIGQRTINDSAMSADWMNKH